MMGDELTRRTVMQGLVGAAIVAGTAGRAAGSQTDDQGEWPQLGRDSAKTGYNPSATGPVPDDSQRVVTNWEYAPEEASISSPPILFDGTVYFVSGAQLVGLDPEDGEQTYRFEADHSLRGPPVGIQTPSLGDELYVASSAGDVVGVSTATGNELWRNDVGEFTLLQSPLSVVGDTLYVGTFDSYLAIDTTDETVLWTVPQGIRTTPAVSGDDVWAAADASVTGLTAEWSEERRDDFDVEQEMLVDDRYVTHDSRPPWIEVGPVSVDDGTVYVPSVGVTAFESSSGRRLWYFDDEVMVSSSPSITDEMVYFASGTGLEDATSEHHSNAGVVYALEKDPVSGDRAAIRSSLEQTRAELLELAEAAQEGEDVEDEAEPLLDELESLETALEEATRIDASDAEWAFETDGAINSKIAVAAETVFVASEDGHLYALDAEDGTERWRYELVETADNDATLTDPVVVDDRLYIASRENGLVALGVETEEEGGSANGTENGETDTRGGDSDGDTTDDDSDADTADDDSDDGFGPGFGVPAGLAALGGAGYALKRRLEATGGPETDSGE